jgi:hypothetical protein
MMNTSFSLGHISITPGALETLRSHGVSPAELLDRHARGDWGDIDPQDQGLNEQALVTGARLLSVYPFARPYPGPVVGHHLREAGHRIEHRAPSGHALTQSCVQHYCGGAHTTSLEGEPIAAHTNELLLHRTAVVPHHAGLLPHEAVPLQDKGYYL